MTTPSTGARQAAKLATRDALIDAALAEFIEHGPSAPSLDAICERAGYTRGAFYVHFADREALLVAVMDRALGELLQAMAGQRTDGADGGLAGGIRHFAAAAAARSPAVHPDRGLRFHHVLEACRGSKKIGDRYRMILTAAAGWAASQRRGRLAAIDAETAGQMVLACGLGLLVLLELELAIDPVKLGDAFVDALELDASVSSARRPRRSGIGRRPSSARSRRSRREP